MKVSLNFRKLNKLFSKTKEIYEDFFSIDLRSLAFARIVSALTVLWTLGILYPHITAFFTDQGIFPRSSWIELNRSPFVFSFHMMGGSLGWQKFLFGLHALFSLMLLLGYKTKFASFATWILFVSLIARFPNIAHSGDNLLSLLLLWGALTPWGARFSIDGALNKLKNIPQRVCSVVTTGFILQMPLAYFFSVLLKHQNSSWKSSLTAVFYSQSPEYVTALGELAAKHQPFWITQFLTIYTVLAEGLGPFLMFFPTLIFFSSRLRRSLLSKFRLIAIVALTFLQIGLALTMSLGLFPLISTLGVLPALPASFWDFCSKAFSPPKKEEAIVFYDENCGFCKKILFILKEFLLLKNIQLRPSVEDEQAYALMQEKNSWILKDNKGRFFTHSEAFIELLEHSLWGYCLASVARKIPRVGDSAYKVVAKNRAVFAYLTRDLNFKNYYVNCGILSGILGSLFLAHMFISCLNSVKKKKILMAPTISQISSGLRLGQNWRMFVSPIRRSGYFVLEATFADKTKGDLFGTLGPITPESLQPLSWASPTKLRSSFIYHNYRWRRVLHDLGKGKDKKKIQGYANYVCQSWNSLHKGKDRVTSVSFYRLTRTKDFRKAEVLEQPEKKLLIDHSCSSPRSTRLGL